MRASSTARGTRAPHCVDVALPPALCPRGTVPAGAAAAAVTRLLDHFLLEHGLASPAPAPAPPRSAQLRAQAAMRLQHACTVHSGAVRRVLFLAGAARTRPLAALLVDLRDVPLTPAGADAPTAGSTEVAALGDRIARHALLSLYQSRSSYGVQELPARTRVHVLVCTTAAVSAPMAQDGWLALAGASYDAALPFTACREAPVVLRFQRPPLMSPSPMPPAQAVFICCDDGEVVSTSGSSVCKEEQHAQEQEQQEQEQCIWWEVPEVLRGG